MTYKEFKNKYNGKVVDYDGSYGGQCWDLAQQYFTECLKLSPSILSGCGWVGNMLKEPKISLLLKYFDEIPTTDMYPGDVVIWANHHIALFDNWNGSYNTYLTQNPGATHLGQCNIGGVVRAFRLKGTKKEELSPILKSVDEVAKEVIAGKWGNGEERKTKLRSAGYSYTTVQTRVNELMAENKKETSVTYIVKEGDNLNKIAKKHNTVWQKIYEDNKSVIGSNPNIIKPGQKLIIR